MAIFGTYHCRLSGSVTVDLLYENISPTYIIPDEFEYVSILTGHKSYSNKRAHFSAFDIDINMFKAGNDIKEIFSKLLILKNEEFYFRPHIDEQEIRDMFGNNIKFHLLKAEPYYLNSQNQYDAMKIKLISVSYSYLQQDTPLSQGYGWDYAGTYGLSGW